jgi:hypothetical protein
MKTLILAPLLSLALVAGGIWLAYGYITGEADRGTITAAQFAKVRNGMPRARVEELLGGRSGYRRDEGGLASWAARALQRTGEPRGATCAYYVDAGEVSLFRVCYGPRGRVVARNLYRR